MTTGRVSRVLLVAALVVASPSLAFAHPMPGVGDFYAGMLHPLTGIASVLPLIAVGLFAGQQHRHAALCMLVAVPVAMTAGAIAAASTSLAPAAEWLALLSMPLIGILVAWAPPLPPAAAVAIAAIPALAIGWANGAEMGNDVSAFRFVSGMALAGLVVVAYCVGVVRRFRAPWMLVAYRVVGSWIAAVGVLVAGLHR